MRSRIKAAWRAFKNPEAEKEALDALYIFYNWTNYKWTPWAMKAAELLRASGREVNCEPGYLSPCDCGDHDYHVGPSREEAP